jgi:hypothetical protein
VKAPVFAATLPIAGGDDMKPLNPAPPTVLVADNVVNAPVDGETAPTGTFASPVPTQVPIGPVTVPLSVGFEIEGVGITSPDGSVVENDGAPEGLVLSTALLTAGRVPRVVKLVQIGIVLMLPGMLMENPQSLASVPVVLAQHTTSGTTLEFGPMTPVPGPVNGKLYVVPLMMN